MRDGRIGKRRFLIPETIQTSAMDCGPAALQSLLAGFDLPMSYGRLREVCKTDVDGTSIDALVELANGLGLEAEEALVPPDHLLAADASRLPAVAVVRTPLGNHFIVLWRRHGDRIQAMDPAIGRRWIRPVDLIGELYSHRATVPADAWRAHGVTPRFLAALDQALRELGATRAAAAAVVAAAVADPSWRSLAALDAATRLSRNLVASGGATTGPGTLAATLHRFERARAGDLGAIPEPFWSAYPTVDAEGHVTIEMRGAVILAVTGRRPADAPAPDLGPRIQRGLARLRQAPPPPPRTREAFAMLFRGEGRIGPAAILGGAVLAAAATTLEIVLLRRLYDVAVYLGLERQRAGMMAVFIAFALGLLLVELQVVASAMRLGRRLEGRMRIALLSRLPRLSDRYFRSRLASDLAHRVHNAHAVRQIPQVGLDAARRTFEILFVVVGLCWLAPDSAILAILAALAAVALPVMGQRVLAERELRQQTHNGALGRHYLDAFLGLVPIRTHNAQRAIRREHSRGLWSWARAGLAVARASLAIEAAQAVLGVALATLLVVDHLGDDHVMSGGFLLLVYWALQLPTLGAELATTVRSFVPLRNATLRLLDPLRAENDAADAVARTDGDDRPTGRGLALAFANVTVHAGGREILRDVAFALEPGEHVAIVGASGSGKSSLLGVVLGFLEASEGAITVDGRPLDPGALRSRTIWVDPTVQLWNRSLLDNLAYGGPPAPPVPIGRVLEEAELVTVLERLPGGLQGTLGESGGMLSGGEGQRVRFGRGLLRGTADLVLLDEPFRGLDRAQRATLLERARAWWRHATLVCVTHDVGETVGFSRVIVVDGGRIVEDGPPAELLGRPGSRYRALHDAERSVRAELWHDPSWRALRFEHGHVRELDDPDLAGQRRGTR